jgi:hypothetical protein
VTETRKERSERLRAAAARALQAAAATGREPRSAIRHAHRLMMKETGERWRVCRGYLKSSPAWPWPRASFRPAPDAQPANPDAPVVQVRRQWNDTRRIAGYVLDDLCEIHWSRTSGGIGRRTPQAFLHAYVLCDRIVSGDLAHSCRHGPPPHRIKVCITKKDNPKLFPRLLELAPPKP